MSRHETGSNDVRRLTEARLEIASIRAINGIHGGEGTGRVPPLAGIGCRARWVVDADPDPWFCAVAKH